MCFVSEDLRESIGDRFDTALNCARVIGVNSRDSVTLIGLSILGSESSMEQLGNSIRDRTGCSPISNPVVSGWELGLMHYATSEGRLARRLICIPVALMANVIEALIVAPAVLVTILAALVVGQGDIEGAIEPGRDGNERFVTKVARKGLSPLSLLEWFSSSSLECLDWSKAFKRLRFNGDS